MTKRPSSVGDLPNIERLGAMSLHGSTKLDPSLNLVKDVDAHEFTIEKLNSELDLTSMTTRSIDSLNLAPNWVYGTATPRQISSSGSGLLLANKGHIAIASPEVIQHYLYPISESLQHKILKYRDTLSQVLNYELGSISFDNDLLVVTGPSFIKNSTQIKGCAKWIGGLLGKKFNQKPNPLTPDFVKDIYTSNYTPENLMLSIRANLTDYEYNKKPKDSIMTYEINQGMPYCRALLDEISEICPIVGETSDTITPQYLGDLFCLGLVSSTLVESQLHRELSSGTSYPIGFQTSDSHLNFNKTMYKHKVQSALDAMFASNQPHQFLSVNKLGTVAVAGTVGNDETFIILELNLELSYDEMVKLIDGIYTDKKLNLKSPRIMLDIGRVSNSNYHEKLSMITRFMTESLKYKIVGVLIDSGDEYLPVGDKVNLANNESRTPVGLLAQNDSFEEINRYFQRNRVVSEDRLGEGNVGQESFYEYFVNANKFIKELDRLSGERKSKY